MSANAARQIRKAAKWWHTNRPAVPDLLGREVERGFDLISTDPYAGAPAHDPRVEGLRRLHLGRVHYFLYYRAVSPEIVEVVAFWHTSRGTAPEL